MKYRVSELLSPTDVGASGTKVIDINIQDPISRLDITFNTIKSKHGMDSYAHKNITKIELVDGSDVLFSMDGGQAQALAMYDRRVPTLSEGWHMTGVGEFDTYPIDFGRKLWDEVLAFNPKMFSNPQLKITYNEKVADTGVSANELAVYASCFDEKVISPVGFLMSKALWETTMGTDGSYEYVDLPTDYPLRQLLIQGYRSAYEPWHVIEKARLSEDNLKRVVWDWTLETYHRIMKGIWTPVEELIFGVCTSAGDNSFYTTSTLYASLPCGWLIGTLGYLYSEYARGGKVTPISNTGSPFCQIMVRGYLPNHCFQFPFGDPNDLEDWYNLQDKGSVQLRLESGSSGANGSGAVVLQQLRKY